MKIRVLTLIAGLVMALGTPGALAQTAWPERPVKLVVPFAAGSGADAMARLLGERLGKAWGQPVVVENAAGAAGNIGVARAAKSAPDGYTLLMSGDAAIVVNVSMYATLPFDPVRDLVPISQMYLSPNVVVANNDLPVRDMPGLVALARAQPGRLAYASSGFGTSTHLGPELLRDMTGIDVVHVPYRDSAVPDLMGGHVQFGFMNAAAAIGLVKGGKLKALGVSSAARLAALPDVPTVAEQGFPGFEAVAWFGLFAPAGTPDPVVRKVHATISALLAEPEMRAIVEEQRGLSIVASTPEAFALLIAREIPRIGAMVKARGLKAE